MKQDALDLQLKQVRQDLRNLAEGWYCDPNANANRDKRYATGKKVLDWLADEKHVYQRIHALQNSLCFDEGDAMELAEFSENRSARLRTHPQSLEQRFPEALKTYLTNWARESATRRWRDYTASSDGGSPWLPMDDFSTFTRYLCDYLCSDGVMDEFAKRLLSVITLAIRDEGDRRHARREYVRVILNDYVLNPGPDDELIEAAATGANSATDSEGDFGLMDSFVRRWRGRLPAALASTAGEHVYIPPGNDELDDLLSEF